MDPFSLAPQAQQDGPMAPQSAPAGASSAATPNALDHIGGSLDKLLEAKTMLSKVRSGLDSLVKLADTVTQDDVIKTAGKLVAAGLTPEGMATMLAEMPEKPEQLMEWIAQHDQDVTGREAQLEQGIEQFRHQLGVQGMQGLMTTGQAQSVSSAPAQMVPASSSAPAGNPMTLQ